MVNRVVSILIVAGLAVILFPLAWNVGFAEETPELAKRYIAGSRDDLGAANVVTAVVVTYRGLDTLGEVTVLFAATTGVGFVITRRRRRPEKAVSEGRDVGMHSGIECLNPARTSQGPSEILRTASRFLSPILLMLGVNGLILTRDLFNVFVFLEIMSIGTYGIIASDDTPEQYAAGFKYLIAGGISSVFVLLGTVYLYRLTGTLNIDGMIANAGALNSAGAAGFTAAFLLFAGILIELKPLPANGWALDTYQAANTGVSSFVSAGNATAVIFVLHKVLPLFPDGVIDGLIWIGVLTFCISNLIGMKQTDARRMLGYSSAAQIGLIAAVLGIIQLDGLSQTYLFIVAGGFLINHLLAKGGLFWIAGAAGKGQRIGPVAGIGAVMLGLALIGLPPFPGFWAKWQLVNTLVATGRTSILVLIVLGSLFEAIYILRWVGKLVAQRDVVPNETRMSLGVGTVTVLIGVFGMFTGWVLGVNDALIFAPFVLAVGMLLLEWLPSRIKAVLAMAAIAGYAYLIYPLASGLALIFGAVFAAGGLIAVFSSLYRSKTQFGTYALYVLAVTSLIGLVVASEPITFFVLWELMTIGSYLLIARSSRAGARGEGIGAERAAVGYIAFSIGGALLIMVGLVLALQASMAGAGGAALPEIFGADGYVRLPALTGGWRAWRWELKPPEWLRGSLASR